MAIQYPMGDVMYTDAMVIGSALVRRTGAAELARPPVRQVRRSPCPGTRMVLDEFAGQASGMQPKRGRLSGGLLAFGQPEEFRRYQVEPRVICNPGNRTRAIYTAVRSDRPAVRRWVC